MGNLKVDSGLRDEYNKPIYVGLTPGFIPIGVNTLNGIAYIVSFNPNTQEGEIGTFPSPDYPLCTPSSDCCNSNDSVEASSESEVLAYDVNSSKEGYELHKNLVNKYQPLYNLYKGCNCSNG